MIVRLVNKITVVESGIRDVFNIHVIYCAFLFRPRLVLGFVWCTYVQNIGLVLGLGLVFVEALKIDSMC